jgi:hypothetical protein
MFYWLIKRGVNHGQGHGPKERRKKETGQDIGGKARCEEGKEASQGLNARAAGVRGGAARRRIRGSSDDP